MGLTTVNDHSSDGLGLSRRTFLLLAGAAGAAAYLTGCDNPGKDKLVKNLPDPLLPGGNRMYAIPDTDYAPPTPPPSHLKPPPPPTQTYGIIPRSCWAGGGPDLRRVDAMNGVSLITFHHSGDPKPFYATDYGETAVHLEYVRQYHRSRKFQDIGYHFAIDRAGRVWQLRSLRYEGQHVRYNNEHNIGVVVLGNFDLQAPTQAQKDKIKQFGLLLRKQYSLPASRIKTHQEIVSTACPGRNMQPYMVQVRRQGLI